MIKKNYKYIHENYEKLIKELIDPELKKIGFKKSGKSLYYKKEGDFIQKVRFDRSSVIPDRFSIDLYIQIMSLPISFSEKLIFPGIPLRRGAQMESTIGKYDLYEDEIKNRRSIIISLKKFCSVGIKWFSRLSNYKKLAWIYENEKDKLLYKYRIGREADLMGAISYEKIGENKRALELYRNISKDDLNNLGKGIQGFVKNKIKELKNANTNISKRK